MSDEKKIEIGMYVRLDRCQGIARIEEIDDGIFLDKEIVDEWGNETFRIEIDDILKASDNIIDLIEVRDLLYVDIDNGYEGGIIVPKIAETLAEFNEFELYIKDAWVLKKVITHEQIEREAYEVINETTIGE